MQCLPDPYQISWNQNIFDIERDVCCPLEQLTAQIKVQDEDFEHTFSRKALVERVSL